MNDSGFTIKGSSGSKQLEIGCEHQSGTLYVVRGERSWVCTDDLLPAHALAGFFKQLAELNDPEVKDVMRQWGLYFRERPTEPAEEGGHGLPGGRRSCES
jgi:hypothetical protein